MAITVQMRTQVSQLYVSLFGRAPDGEGLGYWVQQLDSGKSMVDVANTMYATAPARAYYPLFLTNAEIINSFYQNVFGVTGDTEGEAFWTSKLNGGESVGDVIVQIINAALGNQDPSGAAAKATLENKIVVAQWYGEQNGNIEGATAVLSGVTADPASVTAAQAGGAQSGQTFMLTTGQDVSGVMKGSLGTADTSGNDTFNGLIDLTQVGGSLVVGTNTTFNGFDVINGGAGTNTLKLAISGDATGGYDASLANVEKIQVVELNSTATGGLVTVDATTNADITDLKATKASGAIDLIAADGTNVAVANAADTIQVSGGKNITVNDNTDGKAITIGDSTDGYAVGTITVVDTKQGNADIKVDGGTDVSITATSSKVTADILVGQTGTAQPSGAVTIVQNLNDDGSGLNNAAEEIKVKGGKTVDVTINANSTATAAGKNGALAVSKTTVVGDGKTTDVTITQNATVNNFAKVDDVVVKEKDTVTFKAMTNGQTLTATAGGQTLTFTNNSGKTLTAEQVAAAFAGLTQNDTQSAGGPTANGFYSGNFSNTAGALWTSAEAAGATVVFTAADEAETNITWGGTAAAPTVANTAGSITTGSAKTTNSVTLNDVVVDDHATDEAIKTITLNGFKDATLGGGGSLDALTTLNLTNSSGSTTLTSTSTTLGVTVNKITNAGGKTVALGGNVTDLTLTSTGAASTFKITAGAVEKLTIDAGVALDIKDSDPFSANNALGTVTIKGAGTVNLGSVASTGLKSFSAADNTGGVTATVNAKSGTGVHADFTKFVFSKGNDVVTLDDVKVDKAIELGAGNDSITLDAGVRIADITATIDGGADTNTLVLAADDAEALSADNAFNAKISNFQRLTIGNANSQEVVDLDNIDGISYVTLGSSTGTKQVATVTVTAAVDDAADAGDIFTVTVNGRTYSHTATATQTEDAISKALVAKINADTTLGVVAADAAGTFTLTAGAAGVPFTASVSNPTDAGDADADIAIDLTTTANAYGITLNNLANNGTVVLTDAGTVLVSVKDAGTAGHDSDVLNLITQGAATKNVGYLQADDVETINISATETYTAGVANGDEQTLVLAADSATKVVVGGEGALDLTLFYTSDKVETVDAGTNKGGLTFTASLADLVVKGGTGADDLTANADDVALYGGAGNDTLTVDGGLRVNLHGGDGADKFVISAGASATLDAYTVINGVNSGDVIKMTGANKFSSTKIALSLGADETLLNYANQAVKTLAEGEMGWFQRGGNTYIVQDVTSSGTNSDAFTAGEDMIIMITGLVDLGTGASFNTSNILEIV